MSVMNRSQNCTITPPVHHSSRNSVILETQPVHKETNTSHQLDVEDSKNDAVLRVEAGGDGTSSLLPMSSSSSSVMMMMMMDSSGGVGGGDSGGGAVLETVEVHNTSPTTSKPPSPTDTTTATTAAITTTTTTTTSTTTTAAAAVADHDDDDDDNVDNADADDADDTATPNVALPAVLSTSGSAPPSSSRSPTFRYSFSSSSHSSVSERSSARSLSASSSSLASFVSSYSTVSLSSCPSTTVEPPGTVDESTSTTTTTTTNPTSSSSSSSSSTTTTSTATSPSTTTSTTITACPTATTTTSTTPNSPTTSTTANTPPPTVEPVDVTVTVETAEEPAEDFSPLPSSPVPPSTPPPPSSPPSPPPPPPSVPAVIVSSPVALKQPAKVSLHATDDELSANFPHQITTKVYVEQQLSKSSSLSNTTTPPDGSHRVDADSELSPEPRMKRRKAVRRTKSSLESWYGQAVAGGNHSGSQSHHQLQRSLDCAIASRQRPRVLALDSKDSSNSRMSASHSSSLEHDKPKRLLCRQANVESMDVDSDDTNTDDSTFHHRNTSSSRSLDRKIWKWINKRSPATSTEKKNMYLAEIKARPSQRTSFPPAMGQHYPISLHMPQSASCKGPLDRNVGDIFNGLKDIRHNKRTFSGAVSYGQRLGSGRTIAETTQIINGTVATTTVATTIATTTGAAVTSGVPLSSKSRDSGVFRFMRLLQGSDEKKVETSNSQQSSVVGLDWLFSTDSESVSSGESRSQLEVSESTSTITNDDTSPAATGGDGFDDDISPAGDREQPGQYHLLKEHDNTSPSSPSQDELDLKHCGAIPKKYSLKQSADPQLQSQNLSSSPSDEGPFGASPDPPDPETLCRNIIEILDDNNEFPEKMRKLKAVVQPTKKSYYRNEDQSKESRLKEPTLMKDKATSPAELGAIGGTTQEDGDTRSTDSKSVTPTEASALLPLKDILNKEDSQSRRRRYRRETGRVNMRRVHTRRSPPLRAALFNIIAGGHLASSHDDTTEGAMHYFQDEVGNWFTYTFGENSSGVAQGVIDMDLVKSNDKSFHESTSSSGSGSPVVIEPSPKREEQAIVCRERSLDFHSNLRPTQAFYPWQIESQWGLVEPFGSGHPNVDDISDSPSVTEVSSGHQSIDKPKQFYKFWLFPNKYIKIHFDRLELLALLDRNLTVIENLIAILMAVAVSSLGALVLSSHFYKDFYIFIFCFILASCQYSLLKSVQPDSASPMHGYNRLIVFSRPFYFCLCCGLLKFLDYTIHHASSTSFIIYGFPFTATASLTFAKSLMKVFILLLPVLFMVGLLPQVKTFFMYILEQTDMHIFGGNATTSLGAAVYSVTRSLVAVAALYFFCYYALKQKESSQHVLFSIFCALSVAISYHLSRSASHPGVLGSLIKDMICGKKSSQTKEPGENELIDPLPDKLKKCVSDRLQSDLLVCILFAVIMFAVHVSTVFNSPVLQPYLSDVLCYLAASLGFIIHYIIPQMRKEMPWLCCYTPILPSYEGKHMESDDPAPIMCFEKLYIWLRFVERNIVYPVVFLCALTLSAPLLVKKFGLYFGSVIVVVCGLKLLRFAFSDTLKQHMILAFTVLFFKYDYKAASETFLLDYFVISILFCKFCDLLLKVKFIITYIAPWQITWGSAFHAFAQPFSVPHSAMLFVQAAISAIFSTPLNPFLGSAIFITSYIRPVKFWERDYNTKRVDHSNTCLASQLERNPGADDNNLNSIFYEHLTRSLQHSLCGDVMMGRWGNYCQGDCFIMASDYLNALVHIIETGNGLVTFQLRGLEFRGTYCQQREVEAITEEVNNDEGFCCCELGHLPHLLSLNAAFNQRWLAWEVMVTNYILEGYSISDNSAATMLQVFDLRKLLINYYIKSIIYYTVRSPCLDQWSQNEELRVALAPLQCNDYVDLDPTFNAHVDDDYDSRLLGITRNSFCNVYFSWIQFCAARREKSVESGKDSFLVSLCYGLSLLGRRALCTASHNGASVGVDYFLFRLHALFKGDFRVTSSRDEWVVKDVELLRRVVAPALRMSLKLHQDHFASSDEYDDLQVLYNAISNYEKNMVISHEADPAWRNAVLSNTNSLLALRHVFDEELDEYKIIMLNKRYLSFRIVKVNRECVRGLWAGQQQELIFLRNRNPERGSIQNAKQALRNMINSSCDQPIGYPIYVSPLTTSYSSTHEQLATIIGGEFLLSNVKSFFKNLWFRMRRHCGASCAGRSSGFQEEATYTSACTHAAAAVQLGSMRSNSNSAPPTTGAPSVGGGAATTGSGAVSPSNQSDITLQNLTNSHNSKLSSPAAVTTATTTPTSTATTTPSITALLDSRSSSSGNGVPATAPTAPTVVTSTAPGSNPVNTTTKEPTISQRVRIMDPSQMYDNMNLGRRIDVQWPRDDWKQNGGKSGWNGWTPTKGLEGTIVHRWVPCHRDPVCRSHVDYTILLVQVGSDKYVPIADGGVMHLGVEV
ncbi:1,Pecanex 2,Pecanex 3, pecanex [Octopus vulgaris]|nr:1,Pecanex 2,Pecanex 3, pecanex [Octopus vulgaris]